MLARLRTILPPVSSASGLRGSWGSCPGRGKMTRGRGPVGPTTIGGRVVRVARGRRGSGFHSDTSSSISWTREGQRQLQSSSSTVHRRARAYLLAELDKVASRGLPLRSTLRVGSDDEEDERELEEGPHGVSLVRSLEVCARRDGSGSAACASIGSRRDEGYVQRQAMAEPGMRAKRSERRSRPSFIVSKNSGSAELVGKGAVAMMKRRSCWGRGARVARGLAGRARCLGGWSCAGVEGRRW
jgi:hypothetical protein